MKIWFTVLSIRSRACARTLVPMLVLIWCVAYGYSLSPRKVQVPGIHKTTSNIAGHTFTATVVIFYVELLFRCWILKVDGNMRITWLSLKQKHLKCETNIYSLMCAEYLPTGVFKWICCHTVCQSAISCLNLSKIKLRFSWSLHLLPLLLFFSWPDM